MRERPPAAADQAAPLAEDEFAGLLGRLGPFERAPRLAVAVSGGPDSMALARLANDWVHARGGSLLALIVDHGLRAESAVESALVAGWLRQRGIVSRILEWSGDKPVGGVLAAARAARYGLLEAACRGERMLHLLVAHHYEDQAETVALRAARGSGAVGLAGMAAVREVHGLRVLRPLLAVPKARLMATLRQCDWPWLVDPSNAEPRFARASLRQDHDFVSEIHWRRGYDHAAARSALDRQLGDWLARNARPHALGFVRVEREAWLALAPAHRVLVLERVLLAVAGQAYPARRATLERLAGDGHWAQRSVGGCLARVAGGMLVVVREPGRIRERLMLRAGDEQLWDGRFLVRHAQGAIALQVSALGVGGVQALPGMLKRRLRERSLPAAALAGMPAVRTAGELVACPTLHTYGFTPRPGFSITVALRPAHPLAGPPFAGVNVVSKP